MSAGDASREGSRSSTGSSVGAHLIRWLTTLVGLLVALVGAELGWRLVRNGTVYMPPPFFVADAELAYRLNPVTVPGGFRSGAPGPKTPGSTRVLCIGGSTTFGDGVRSQETWPAVLAETLAASGPPVDTINAGVPGYGTNQNLHRWRRELRMLAPDVVVIHEGWNRSGVVVDPTQFAPLGMRPGDGAGPRGVMWLGQRSQLLRDFTAASLRVPLWFFGRPYVVDQHQDEFEADLRAMVDETSAAGAQPVLVVYPALYHADMSPAEQEMYGKHLWEGRRYTPEMLIELQRKHAAIRRIAADTGIPIADGAAAFASVRGADRLPLFFDEGHLTAAGNRRLAEVIAAVVDPLLSHQMRPAAVH